MNQGNFIRGVEKLINPITVGSLHFIQSFNKLLPKKIQKKIVESSSKKIPYMGFVVEPYAFFLCYEIADTSKATSLLPDGFQLIKTSIMKNDEPKYYGIIGCFRSHTSAFWGTRAECYVIAEDKKTGLLSWMIIDYDSDTISYDSQNGLRSPNCGQAVHATDYSGTLYVDIKRDDFSRRLAFTADLNNAKMAPLNQRLWLEGNLSIGYGRLLSDNNSDIFSLKFNPEEVVQALDIPLKQFTLEENSWYPKLFKELPAELVCFPYAQHFISDSPGASSKLKNKEELLSAISKVNFNSIKVFSTKSFTRMFFIGSLISTTIIVILIVFLIIK
jgi:hypothetical protein